MASRPTTPLLFRGKQDKQDLDTENSTKENGGLAIPKPTRTSKSGPDAVSVLEAKVNGA